MIHYRNDVPKRLRRIIERAQEADPADRFPSARAMANELGAVLKEVQARMDLYALLANTVVEARTALDMGGRTQAPMVAEAIPEDESQIAIPLLLRTAWRRLRSRIPFLGSDDEPVTLPPPVATPAPPRPVSDSSVSAIRRANKRGVVKLSPGDEADIGELKLRLLPLDHERTPTDPVIQLDVTHGDVTERLGLEVPGQALHVGYLLTALSRSGGKLSLRASPVRAGVSMPMFPYVPVVIGELTVEVTGVGEAKVFFSLTRDGHRPEHLIVAASDTEPATITREGYRLTVERVAPPWVTVRVDEVDDIPELDAGDLIEV